MRIWLIVGLVVIAVTVSACDRNRINLVVTEPQPYAALESEPERVTFNLTGFGIYVPLPPDYAAEFAGASIDGQMFEGAHVPDVDVTLSSNVICVEICGPWTVDIPASLDLEEGLHSVVATTRYPHVEHVLTIAFERHLPGETVVVPAWEADARSYFAITEQSVYLEFSPDQVVLARNDQRDWAGGTTLFVFDDDSIESVAMSLEAPAGLTVDTLPFTRLLPADGGPGPALDLDERTPEYREISIRIGGSGNALAPGPYEFRVSTDASDDEPALLTVVVPHSVVYDVDGTIESDRQPTVAMEDRVWVLSFNCSDARCDGRLSYHPNAHPLSLAYTGSDTYELSLDEYVGRDGLRTWRGTVTVTEREGSAPSSFDFEFTQVIALPDVVGETRMWSGSGRRQ